jgi:hypothetical protein
LTATTQLSLSLPHPKQCFIESARGFGPIPDFDGVSGFDPETKKWKSVFFNAKGECVTRYCHTPKLEGKEASFQVEFLNAAPTGQVTKEKATWRFRIVSEKRSEIHATNLTKDGQTQPDIEAVFERK